MFTAHTAPRESASCRWTARRRPWSTPSATRSAFPSILFRCCRKIFFTHCMKKLYRTTRFIRCEESDDRFLAARRNVRNLVHHQRPSDNFASSSDGTPARCAAPRTTTDRNKRRLRRGRVWLLLHLDGRHTGE